MVNKNQPVPTVSVGIRTIIRYSGALVCEWAELSGGGVHDVYYTTIYSSALVYLQYMCTQTQGVIFIEGVSLVY